MVITMKKILIIIIIACLAFSACSKSEESSFDQTGSSASVSDTVSFVDKNGTSTEGSSSSSISVSSKSALNESSSDKAASSSVKASSSIASSAKASSVQSSQAVKLPRIVTVTIPEGYSISQIGTLLETSGVCDKAGFMATVNSYDFSYYSLIGQISANVNRCYKLEGYLFPNTYEFYTKSKPQDAIGKMLKNAESKIGTNFSYTGMTTDEIVTLASIIEKEANSAAEMKKISSVYHNRLKAKMKLQADPTINYIEFYVKPNLSGDINRYNSFYNTYKCSALPTGPICSPGAAALRAAAEPDSTEYLYFAADKAGKYYYATTFQEHVNNCIANGIVDPSSSSSGASSIVSSLNSEGQQP